jgi:hypothetical protein
VLAFFVEMVENTLLSIALPGRGALTRTDSHATDEPA